MHTCNDPETPALLVILEKLSMRVQGNVRVLTAALCKKKNLEANQIPPNRIHKLDYYTAIKIN